MSRLRITLKRSVIGRTQDQKDTARILGLTRINRTVLRPDNPSIRGMVNKLSHLVSVEEVEEEDDTQRGS
ncbi:MAG: 50S ribosomal protein L30 [Armatimonadota bacterium]|nr:50S ribosomal protein L30 [Armatimonadota bacterium]